MFIGHTRFSLFLPGDTSWRASRGELYKSEDEYRDYLFSQDRLDTRSRLFFEMSLPQLSAAAENHDVTHVVSYTETLPERYKRLIEDAAAEHSFLVPNKVSADRKSVSRSSIAKEKAAGAERVFAEYRLDDDDILSVDYFDQLASYTRPEFVGMVVSFGAGITAIYLDGQFYDVRWIQKPKIAVGLARICGVASDGSITAPRSAPSHMRVDEYAPLIVDSRRPSYISTRHQTQDSSLMRLANKTEEERLKHLRWVNQKNPPVEDVAIAETPFPHIAHLMTGDLDLNPPVG